MRNSRRMNRASESLVGNIKRVTLPDADNGFAVLKIALEGHRDLVAVVRLRMESTAEKCRIGYLGGSCGLEQSAERGDYRGGSVGCKETGVKGRKAS